MLIKLFREFLAPYHLSLDKEGKNVLYVVRKGRVICADEDILGDSTYDYLGSKEQCEEYCEVTKQQQRPQCVMDAHICKHY
jgi:hypothetical protein